MKGTNPVSKFIPCLVYGVPLNVNEEHQPGPTFVWVHRDDPTEFARLQELIDESTELVRGL